MSSWSEYSGCDRVVGILSHIFCCMTRRRLIFTCFRLGVSYFESLCQVNTNPMISDTLCIGPRFDIIILDYRVPGENGIQVAEQIIRINPKQRTIIASSYPSETLSYSMKKLGHIVELVD